MKRVTVVVAALLLAGCGGVQEKPKETELDRLHRETVEVERTLELIRAGQARRDATRDGKYGLLSRRASAQADLAMELANRAEADEAEARRFAPPPAPAPTPRPAPPPAPEPEVDHLDLKILDFHKDKVKELGSTTAPASWVASVKEGRYVFLKIKGKAQAAMFPKTVGFKSGTCVRFQESSVGVIACP